MSSRRLFGLVLAVGLALGAVVARTDPVVADPPALGAVYVHKIITGPQGVALPSYTADFDVVLDCGSGTITSTATGTTIPTIPGPAAPAFFYDLPTAAFCTLSEGPLPPPPDGFAWIDPVFSPGNKVTIGPTDHQITLENRLVPKGLWVDKAAATDPDGPFDSHSIDTFTGRSVYFRIILENVGDLPLTAVTLSDDRVDLAAKGCDAPTGLAAGERFECTYSDPATIGVISNTATADSAETEAVSDSVTVSANQVPPNQLLTISKTTNARKAFLDVAQGPDVVVSTAEVGDTITYTLKYRLETESVQWLTIVDTVPAGITYVPFSATANDEIFPYPGPAGEYDPVARTLTWTTRFQSGGLGYVTHDGSVSYRVTVFQGAADLPQPLRNVAAISSQTTPETSAEHLLYIGPLPDGVHFAPDPTAPSTDAVEAGEGAGSGPGVGLWLVVFVLAGLVGGSVLVGRVPGARGVRPR